MSTVPPRPSAAPLLSVVIAVKNGMPSIVKAVESVLTCVDMGIELIVVDGASTDGTVPVLERLGGSLAHWESAPDAGIAEAWNKGIARSKGEWVVFLGADDSLAGVAAITHALSMLAALGADVGLVAFSVDVVGRDGSVLFRGSAPVGDAISRLKRTMAISHQGAVHRRAAILSVGSFSTDLIVGADYDLVLRLMRRGWGVVSVPDLCIARMGFGGLSTRPENFLTTLREHRVARMRSGFAGCNREWLLGMVRAYGRLVAARVLGRRNAALIADAARAALGLPKLWRRSLMPDGPGAHRKGDS